LWGDSAAAGSVLAVTDDEIHVSLVDECLQMVAEHTASGLADDVPDTEYVD
ncbi:hypothetical protein LCGC14_2838460, partial [marine sediment metagenome]